MVILMENLNLLTHQCPMDSTFIKQWFLNYFECHVEISSHMFCFPYFSEPSISKDFLLLVIFTYVINVFRMLEILDVEPCSYPVSLTILLLSRKEITICCQRWKMFRDQLIVFCWYSKVFRNGLIFLFYELFIILQALSIHSRVWKSHSCRMGLVYIRVCFRFTFFDHNQIIIFKIN